MGEIDPVTHASWAVILNELTLAQPEGAAPAADGPVSILGSPLFLIVIMVMIFYFLVFMPQRRRDKERRDMLGALKKGDQVITTGGICGTVIKVNESRVVVKVNDDPAGKIEFVREAIARIEPKEAAKGKGSDSDDEDDDSDN
jgi:preprotein translocase subunit YajC